MSAKDKWFLSQNLTTVSTFAVLQATRQQVQRMTVVSSSSVSADVGSKLLVLAEPSLPPDQALPKGNSGAHVSAWNILGVLPDKRNVCIPQRDKIFGPYS